MSTSAITTMDANAMAPIDRAAQHQLIREP
jgi:hypothetical protein